MIFLTGEVHIKTSLGLDAFAKLLSEKLFQGLRFAEDDRLDETPGRSLRVLGLDVFLYPERGGFTLQALTLTQRGVAPKGTSYVNISGYLSEQLAALGLNVEVTKLGK